MTKKGIYALADKLFSLHIRERGVCQAAVFSLVRCSNGLQCCHIRSRRYTAIRWADDNALSMCPAHHVYFTHHPLEWEQFILDLGIDYDALRLRGLNDPPMDPAVVVARLREAA